MPVKNRIKQYAAGGIYHIYNRGIDGREIFCDGEDYEMWISLMGRYLGKQVADPDSRFKTERPYIVRHKKEMNLNGKVKVLAYCLLPDHFHILIKQETTDGMTQMMRRVVTNYVMYFNRRYKRHGVLFENVYRAVQIPDTQMAVWLGKYIHLNPLSRTVRRFGLVETSSVQTPEYYLYSSYQNYIKSRNEPWVDVDWMELQVKQLFPDAPNYKSFVEDGTNWKLPELGEYLLER